MTHRYRMREDTRTDLAHYYGVAPDEVDEAIDATDADAFRTIIMTITACHVASVVVGTLRSSTRETER